MVNFIKYLLVDKKWKVPVVLLVLLVTGIGYVISNPLLFHLCTNIYRFGNELGCSDDMIDHVGVPLFTFSSWILLSSIFALLTKKEVFNSWVKFVVWAVPLGIFYIWTTHVNSNAWMDFFPFYRNDAARLAGEVFAGTSFGLIIFKLAIPRIHAFYSKKYDYSNANAEVKELLILLVLLINLACLITFLLPLSISGEILQLSLLLLSTSFISIVYVLFRIFSMAHKKITTGAKLGWKLISSIPILIINIAIFVYIITMA